MITLLKEDGSHDPPDLADLQWWANTFGITHPVVNATEIYWGTAGGWPTFFVLDQNMQCRYKDSGYHENALINLIEDLLQNPPTPTGDDTPTPTPTSEVPTATPEPPSPTPTPTQTGGFEGVRLEISDVDFQAGDQFLLTAEADGEPEEADFYCALEVMGSYYFYPSWGMDLDYETLTLPADFDVLGPFTWPAVEGSLTGLHFYGLLTHEGTLDWFGEIGTVEFGYSP